MLEATQKVGPVNGNLEAVAVLKKWLEKAEKGLINHCTVTTCEPPNLISCDWGGTSDMQFAVNYCLDTLKLKMAEQARASSGPTPTGEYDASCVCYNVGDKPVSYDFLLWLIDAEMTRVREGAPAPLRVCFVKGNDGSSGLNTEYRRTMFANVVLPLLKLAGAVEDRTVWGARSKDLYTVIDIVKAAKAGEKVPMLKASSEASGVVHNFLHGGPAPITITMRESKTFGKRNSNLEAWRRFADEQTLLGERVIFVRDTAEAGAPILGHETFPTASVNLDVRTALYEQAKANLFVANGPWNIALFGTRPWLMFTKLDPTDTVVWTNTPMFWKDSQGVCEGEQFPWSLPTQRIIWDVDSYDNITKAWGDLALRA